jgi:hypothetical protein
MQSQNPSSTRCISKLGLIIAIFTVQTLPGCDDGKLKVYPVHGTVNVDGKPAAGAMVIFCPLDDSNQKLQRERPFGTTGADGKFTLTTFVKDDGAPVGEYKVLVQWAAPPKPGGDRDRDSGSPDRLKGRYMNLEKTPLTAKIEGTTELAPYDLKTQ